MPQAVRLDGMCTLGKSEGKRFSPFPPTIEIATHHGIEVVVCPTGDASRKGQIERPFRHLKETFLENVSSGPPVVVDDMNQRAQAWAERQVHRAGYRTSKVLRTQWVDPEKRSGLACVDIVALAATRIRKSISLVGHGWP